MSEEITHLMGFTEEETRGILAGPHAECNQKIATLLKAAKKVMKAYLRLPIGPDVEAIVIDEMEELELAIAQAEGK